MLYKPRGLVSACTDSGCETVMSCFEECEREGLFHVGRLDKDTEGLILITDDGDLCFRLMRPEFKVKKKYYFIALGDINDGKAEILEGGAAIYRDPDKLTAPARLEILSRGKRKDIEHLLNYKDGKKSDRRSEFPTVSGYLTITEGKKHQVRRMLKSVGCHIVFLKRLSIGEICLDEGLKPGEYRALTDVELASVGVYKEKSEV